MHPTKKKGISGKII